MPEVTFDTEALKKAHSRVRSRIKDQTSQLEKVKSTPGNLDELAAVERRPSGDRHLQIRVPTAEELWGTVITAGRRQEKWSYDGFGLATNRHVIVDARGGKADSTLTLQSNGAMHLQTDDDSLYAIAKGPAVVSSSSAVNVAGSGGVVITGGLSSTVENPEITEEAPVFPAALEGYSSLQSELVDGWKATDDLLEERTGSRDELQSQADPEFHTVSKIPAQTIKLGDSAEQALSTNNKLGEAQTTVSGAVVVHGDSGLFLDSKQGAVTRAKTTLAHSAKNVLSLGDESVDLFSEQTLSAVAKTVGRIIAGEELRLIAKTGQLLIAARDGEPVKVNAQTVLLGETAPMGPQKPTESVSIQSTANVTIGTDSDANGADGIHLESHDVIEGKSKKEITLDAKEKLTIKTTNGSAKIIVDSGGEITIKAKSATATVSDSGGIKLKHKQAEVEAATSTVTVKVGGSNKVEVGASGVTVKGSAINLG